MCSTFYPKWHRGAWGASIRYVVNSIGYAASTQPQVHGKVQASLYLHSEALKLRLDLQASQNFTCEESATTRDISCLWAMLRWPADG